MREWSPYVIKVVLHHYASKEKFELDDLPLYRETISSLTEKGLVAPNEFGYVDVTQKGEALVQAWCATPTPILKWVDPRFESQSRDF